MYNGSNGCPSKPPLNTVQNYEGGFKIQNIYTYIDASVYDKEFKGLVYQPVNIEQVPLGPITTYGSTAKGVRLVGSVNPLAGSDVQPLKDFKITVNANYENAHYKDYNGCFVYTNIDGKVICGAINGVQLQRLPKSQYRITPSDTQTFDWGKVGDIWQFRVLGSNLTNQFGLTEGNARVEGNAVQNNVGFGRSILGREINIQAKYKF